jgi:hypothetical protein
MGPLILTPFLIAQMTLLNCLTAAVPARERVITCVEVFELLDPAAHVTPVSDHQLLSPRVVRGSSVHLPIIGP